MPITFDDRFLVRAPIDDVWSFLIDPHRVVTCMPGAHLERVESERSFLGRVKLAIGPFHTSYRGRITFAEIDEAHHRAHLTAEGHERGGADARGTMISSLRETPEGTIVVVDITVDGSSPLVRLGISLTENVAHELFEQFVANVKHRLEAPGTAPAPASKPVRVVPLLAKALARRFRQRSPGSEPASD
jgi:uncharacterized protein